MFFAGYIVNIERMLGLETVKRHDPCRATAPVAKERQAVRLPYNFRICLNRGAWFGSAASKAFQRMIRAPCDSKNARSSGVKNEEPSARRLNSRRSRPSGSRNLARTSVMKNFQ